MKGRGKARRAAAATHRQGRYPYSLEGCGLYLDQFAPPADPFDANGSWQNTYGIYLLDSRVPIGHLRIERVAAEGVTLKVDEALAQSPGSTRHLAAAIRCAKDALATPLSWEVTSSFQAADGSPVSALDVRARGRLAGRTLHTEVAGRAKRREIGVPATANWCLLDAVQRLSRQEQEPLEFTLLDELDLVKGGQRLAFTGMAEVPLGGKSVPVAHYEHVGEGILAQHYWVDEQRRLLFAVLGTYACLYDPMAPERREEARRGARRKRQ